MKNFLFFMLLILAQVSLQAQKPFFPPKTPVQAVTDTLHGLLITDDYRWLENKADPAVINWTRAQHDYGIAYLEASQKKHDGLREDITAYIDRDYESPLNKEGKRIFQTVKRKGDKQNKLYTILNGQKILIWDPVQLDTTGNTSTSGVAYTYDGERAAISVQKSGAEITTTYVIDTRTGKILFPPLENTFGFQWTKDQQHAYITLRSKTDIDKQLPLKTYWIKVGDPLEKAREIGTTADAKNSYYTYDNRYSDVSFAGESDFYSNSCYIRKTGSFDKGQLIYESKKSAAYPEAIGDKLYIFTNDNAPNYKLLVADKNNPESKNWKVLIPESKTVMQSYAVTRRNIIIQDKIDIQSRLTLYDLNGKRIKQIELPETGNVSGLGYDREEDSVYVNLNTFTSETKVFIASPSNFKWRLYYQRDMKLDMSNIVGEIKFYNSKDSTRVPVFVVHRKDMKLDGNNPVLLTAYGGFNYGIQPDYYGFYASFLNKGGIVVEAGIRGGDEYGEKWHENGMLAHKQNCFDDFNSCAEWLVKEKYTNTSRIVALGGSNGGLLMGAVATERPELFKAIVCMVPLLDMLRYQKFLIARYWIPEYGTAENEADFRWLLQYSPYQNIRRGINVPTMLVTAGENDSRVDPIHAKKFVAALQNNPGQINPVILHMDYNSGHGSGQATSQRIDNWVFIYEFIMNQLGM
ncbi:MAG: prolyl oligopeptidase family serine peptidase [Bacteroidota bacterium]